MTPPQRTLSRAGVGLVGGLVALTIASLALFPYTEHKAGFFVRAIHQYDTLDLQRWAYTYDDNDRSRYGPYLALGIAAPGSTVIVADGDFDGDPTVDQRLYSFGEVARVVHVPGTGADILGGLDPDPFVLASGASTSHGPAWILAARATSSDATAPGHFVMRALEGSATATTEARTFVLVSVPMVGAGDKAEVGLALVEGALLPQGAPTTDVLREAGA